MKNLLIRILIAIFLLGGLHSFEPFTDHALAAKYNRLATKKMRQLRYGQGVGKSGVKALRDGAWSKGREAQHLLMHSLKGKYGLTESDIDTRNNVMMIPQGNRYAKVNGLKGLKPGPAPAYAKNKLAHIKSGLSHPQYNKFVHRVIQKTLGGATGTLSGPQKLAIKGYLRELHRAKKPAGAKFVDDLNKIPDKAIPTF
ncbi:MAG: hypothetical protein M3Q07_21255 [Pseudobdellovibrionaceae bacterium]|uniref:hypothetical protein n=1 Tax=Oligoflexus sp. TaxID=1971216 RepID=UPI0027CF7B98|nr:hypothetical protein [Oligoflexus sp.]MDQ3234343.1 hypothetical protein [Pseudobdellovibrionaceae bacterium]HYX32243.1 hypothetical protein [Oligoflexus sp.]